MKRWLIFLALCIAVLAPSSIAAPGRPDAARVGRIVKQLADNFIDPQYYGANGTDLVDDTQAFRDALTDLGTLGGGRLSIPKGTFLIGPSGTPLDVPNNVVIEGCGYASMLKKTSGTTLFDADSTSNVTFSNFAIDINADTNFHTAISCNLATNTTVEKMHIYSSTEPDDVAWTWHSVLARGENGLRISDCDTENCQMKLAGPGGGFNITCSNNRIRTSHNLAISVVVTQAGDQLENVLIHGNQIIDPAGQGGIYIGTDHDVDVYAGSFSRNITVSNNQVVGVYAAADCHPIFTRPLETNTTWTFVGNTCSNDDTTYSLNTTGLWVKGKAGTDIQNLIIAHNTIKNMDRAGIAITGQSSNVVLADNLVDEIADPTACYKLTGIGTGIVGKQSGNIGTFLKSGTVSLTEATTSFGVTIDGSGSVITTGSKGRVTIPYDMTITGWTLLADQAGSIVIDVRKDTYANYPPDGADSVAGSEKPTLSGVIKNTDVSLSTWTPTVTAGDIFDFTVESATTVTRATLVIQGFK